MGRCMSLINECGRYKKFWNKESNNITDICYKPITILLWIFRKMCVKRKHKAISICIIVNVHISQAENCWRKQMFKLQIKFLFEEQLLTAYVRFQGLTATSMNITASWDVAPCSLVEVDHLFTVPQRPDDGGSTHLWNVCLLHPRRL
jgi:hypothetical protein